MPRALTMGSTVTCGHQVPPKVGSVQKASLAKLKVNGQPVLLESSIVGKAIPDCGTVPKSPPPPGPVSKPCSTVSTVTGGASLKLKVGGMPVMLETLGGSTDGVVENLPQTSLSGQANQPKLKAP
jgi:hypothetical protein